MKRYLVGLAFGLALLAFSTPKVQPFTYGYVIGPARDTLATLWDNTDPYQVERVYQVAEEGRAEHPLSKGDSVVFVTKVVPCDVHFATNDRVSYSCPNPHAPVIHTHLPITCDSVSCWIGGRDAYNTNASRTDRESMVRMGYPYGVLQVAREVFVFYWPERPPRKFLGIF